jgi:HK97 family phage portal protein
MGKKLDYNIARTVQGDHPSNPAVAAIWGLQEPATAGVYVDELATQNVATVYACVTLISQTLACLPIGCFKKMKNDDREAQDQHPAHWMFNKSPDEIMTSFMANEASQGHVLLRGNSYFELIRNFRGQATEAYLLDPRRMSVEIDERADKKVPVYKYTQPKGVPEEFDRSEVLHFANYSSNGLVGIAPLTLFRESLGLTIAANRYASEYFRKGGHPLGFITRPTHIQDKERDTLREEWKELYGSLENSHQVGILSGGLDWKNIGMSNHDAQLLGLRQFQKYEIASLFRTPPFLLGDTEQPLADIESVLIQFLIFTILPWMKRREGEMNFKVFTPKERHTYYLEYNADAVLRGSFKDRQEALEVQMRNGALLLDEWRHMENRNSLPDGMGKIPLVIASQLAKLADVISGKVNLDTTTKEGKKTASMAKAYQNLPEGDKNKLSDIIVLLNERLKMDEDLIPTNGTNPNTNGKHDLANGIQYPSADSL